MSSKITIDQKIRAVIGTARHRMRLTQEQAAVKSGISYIWYSQLESGVRDVTTLDTLLDIFEALHVPPRILRKAGHTELAGPLEMRLDWFAGDALGS